MTDVGTGYLELYSKKFASGKVTLGGNLASPAVGAKTNYIIAAVASVSDHHNSKVAYDQNKAEEAKEKEVKPQNLDEQTAEIYPNPASTEWIVAYASTITQQLQITIADANAKIVKVVPVWVQAGINQITLPATELNNGVYLVSIISGHHKISKKVIVAKP